MHFAKVSSFAVAVLSCVIADERRYNGPFTSAVNYRSRIPNVYFRNEIPAVFQESRGNNMVLNEAIEIPGYLNGRTFHNDIPQSYSFDYKATDEEGNVHYSAEQADVRGSYGYTDIGGLYRTVSYVADATGFPVFITTNEPGIYDKESPADVYLIAIEPSAGIQEKYNEYGGTGDGGLTVFGSRIRAGGNSVNTGAYPILWTTVPRNVYVDVAHNLAVTAVGGVFTSGNTDDSIESKEDDDNYPKKKPAN